MTAQQLVSASATVLLALGLWLLLPRGTNNFRRLGAIASAAALGLFAWRVVQPTSGHVLADVTFLLLAGTTIVSALGTVSMKNPVYCALWFALTLAGTAGLFLFQGAQFLGVATIVVYAGAILVTFLFVLMLAQPEGHAPYDRVSWEGLLSACTAAVLVGILTAAISATTSGADSSGDLAGDLVDRFTSTQRQALVLDAQHVAALGSQLFSRHLVAVEVAGTLLLAALLGAASIVAPQARRSSEDAPRHD